MNTLVWLAIILFVLMTIVGGYKGVRSFISLFLNFGIFLLTVIFMLDPSVNPIYITGIACIFISLVNLFYVNGINDKTKTAFVATVITIVLLLFFIRFFSRQMMIGGFGEESMEELLPYSLHIGIDFVKIATAMIIMSTIGAIIDVAISITSPMQEIFTHNKGISRKDLYDSGIHIGRDILGSNTNTLFFAFFGGYFALLLWFKDLAYSSGKIMNAKIFVAEMITILCAGIGIALVIPIAAGINAYFLVKVKKQRPPESETNIP